MEEQADWMRGSELLQAIQSGRRFIGVPFSSEPTAITFLGLHETPVIAIIGSRCVCRTRLRRSKRPVRLFQKAPPASGAFWFLLFKNYIALVLG